MSQTLTEIKSLLAAHGLRPKKKFGQNFLHDANKMRAIIEAAHVEHQQTILEVGPGTGTLTEALLEAGANVLAVEVDRDLEPILTARLKPFGARADLWIGDILAGKHALNSEVLERIAGRPFKLVANLPYNVASPLLVNLVVDHPGMELAVVMVQSEVADRLAAGPGGKDYGPLGIMVQAMCYVERVTTLPPSCFWPAPTIESTVLRIVRRDQPLTADPAALADIVQTLFRKRRKQIGTILGRATPLPDGIDANARPEQLSIEQLIALSVIHPD